MAPKQPTLVYAPSPADRKKHKDGAQPYPTILQDIDGYPIGKCPADMSMEAAQDLLDEGIPFAGRNRRSPYPQEIFNVHDGIPYRAHQKEPGRYHGFPERPSRIRPDILEQLRSRAKAMGDIEAFEQWRREVDVDDA